MTNIIPNGKKILILISVPFYKSSGSPRAIFFKVKALSDLDYNIDLLCYPHGEDISLNGLSIYRSPKRKIFNNYLPGQFRKKIIYDFFIFLAAIKFLKKNDYKFVLAIGSMIYYGRILNFFSKKKFIALPHGDLKTELSKWNITKSNLFGNLARKIDASTLNTYHLVFCEGKNNIKPLFNKGLKTEKVYIIQGLAISSPVLIKKKETINFIVLYTGTFVKVQNIALIYETAKLLKNENIEFRLIGGEISQIQEEKIKIGNLQNVKFYERLPQDEFEEFYCEADIVISPRKFGDDCPMKIQDYLNFGKCILAADAYLHWEFLNSEIAYLIKPTAEDFAAAIIYLRDNIEERENYALKGKEFFKKELSFEEMKKKLSLILEKYNL